MNVIEEVDASGKGGRAMLFECPGCEMSHMIYVDAASRPNWTWNGSMDRPTFQPSILVTGVQRLTEDEYQNYLKTQQLPEPKPLRCHSFVTDGRIQFLSDCTHAMAGQTVDLLEIET